MIPQFQSSRPTSGSPEHLQEEPSVELGSISELLLPSEYSDIRKSISLVRKHLLSRA
jgi:hypothetical protein